MSTTLLDELCNTLLAARAFIAGSEAAPEAIIWCDPKRDFVPLITMLRERLPQLLTLGEYEPNVRSGPALWLRAAAARKLPNLAWQEDLPPILYLPGVGREILRGAEDCDPALQPLVWYAVAGTFFGHKGRDWTLRGFLSAQDSPVHLDIPDDAVTRTALARAATKLFVEPVAALHGVRWDAAALDALLVPDPVQDMLRWMNGTLTENSDPERFAAFAARAAKDFAFDPRKKLRQDAATRLAKREKAWAGVWDRFEEGGGNYDGIVALLRAEEPPDLLSDPSPYPRTNEAREIDLRRDLLALSICDATAASARLRDLEKAHAWRRDTVWARRGEAPLALALRHLTLIADTAALPSHDADVMAKAYMETGWRADAAALHALDIARHGDDRDAVISAIRAVYLPWLEQGATALQAMAALGKVVFSRPAPPKSPPSDRTILLFVDGLRMDLAHELAELLRVRGAIANLDWVWSGFPTVTATCKPLVSPAAGSLKVGSPDSLSLVTNEGKTVTKPVLFKAIEAAGWSTSEKRLGNGPGWRECGRFDEEGHALGARLAERFRDGLRDVVETVMRLAREGRSIRIVTDHGWLLLPGGLEQAALDAGLVEPDGKRSRVASLKPGALTGYTLLPWTWAPSVNLAVATGARAFFASQEYAHGGVSPQECILPVLDIHADAASPALTITPRWQRLRLKIEVAGGAGLMFDVRLGPDTSGQSILKSGAKQLDDLGQLGVLISEDYLDKQVCLVVHAPGKPEEVLAKHIDTIKD